MEALHLVIDGLVSIVAYALLIFGVYKIYQVSTEVAEIKEIVRDIQRNTDAAALVNAGRPQTPEALVRAINAASLSPAESEAVPGS